MTDETIEGEVVVEEEAETPDEAAQEHVDDIGQSARLQEAESMALELREKAVGPTQTIPALAELNAIDMVAQRLAASGIVPAAYRGRPDDVVAAILMGRELGIGPMQSLKDIAVIDGRPALSAHLQMAVLRRAGVRVIESEVTDDRAMIKAQRPDGEVGTVEWTFAEAEKVMRKGKKLSDGDNWRNYRQDMLWARAVGRWTRRYGSDLVAGMPYTAEEVRDFSDENDAYGYGTPVHRQEARQPGRPTSRAELLKRFAQIFGDADAEDCKAIAVAFVKEALQTGWNADSFPELASRDKGAADVAFQKIASAVMLLEEETPDLSISTGVRDKVAAAFAKRMEGVALIGPEWRLGPDEPDLLMWQEIASQPVPEYGGDKPLIEPGPGDEDIPFGDPGYE